MSYDTLEKVISQYLQYRLKESIFNWQGGEPTLAGLDFFKKVVSLQQKHDESRQVIGNAFHPNGILINDDWAGFLNDYRFLVGLSLDGPKATHDHYRKSAGDKSVWEKVMKAADFLKRNNVEFNILCVVSKANINRVKEVYNFFLENEYFYIQLFLLLKQTIMKRKSHFQ